MKKNRPKSDLKGLDNFDLPVNFIEPIPRSDGSFGFEIFKAMGEKGTRYDT